MQRGRRPKTTYGEKVGGIKQQALDKRMTSIDNNTRARILSCMLHVHFVNSANPGTYEEVLSKTLTCLPSRYQQTHYQKKKYNEVHPEKMEEDRREETQEKEERKTQEEATNTEETRKKSETLKSTELRLKIYTPKTKGWPKTTLTLKQIIRNIKEGKYKFT